MENIILFYFALSLPQVLALNHTFDDYYILVTV